MFFLGCSAINAQAETVVANSNEIRPVNLKVLYTHLELDMNQFKVLKTFYADTNEDRLNQLRVTTDEAERAAIERETLVLRDDKIRSLLTPSQLIRYNELQQPDIANPDIPADTNVEPGGGQ